MKWCRFREGGRVRYGLVEGHTVAEVDGSPFDGYRANGTCHPLSSVKLLVPCVPPTFYSAGNNYMDHIRWTAQLFGREAKAPTRADIGYRGYNALAAHQDPIVIPRDSSGDVHHGGELVAVVGKEARRLSHEEALGCLLGYTIGNDISDRTWQGADKYAWRLKSSDTFKPMGPWIDTEVDPKTSVSTVRINGEVVSQFDTGNMIFDVADFITEMSQNMTLYPGDVIWMGCDGPTIPALGPGDVVEVEITGIGTLSNPVARET